MELGPEERLPLPDTIKETVLLRAERLSSVGRHTLEIAAAAGLGFDLELLAALGGADGIDEAIQRGFLVEVDQQGGFRHALIREAVYDDTPWTRRRSYHRRLAAELERRGAAPEAVAEQWLAGGERDRARPSLLAAAERFCQVHAYHDAARAISRAIELWPEGEDEDGRLAALERLGRCAQLHGDLAGAARAWQEVAEAGRARGDLVRLAELQRRLAGIYELQGAWERALAARAAAAEAFAERGRTARQLPSAWPPPRTCRPPPTSPPRWTSSPTLARGWSAPGRSSCAPGRCRSRARSGPSSATPSAAWNLPARGLRSRWRRTSPNRRPTAITGWRRPSSTPPATPKRSTPTRPPPTSASSRAWRAWGRSASPAWRW